MADTLGTYLRTLRGSLSLRTVAEKTGGKLSHSYISDLEKGQSRRGNIIKPTPETLKILADVYSTNYDHLMKLAGYLKDDDQPQEIDLGEQIEDKTKILKYQGRPIPEEDLNIIMRLLKSGKDDDA